MNQCWPFKELKEPTLLLNSHNYGYDMEIVNAYMLLAETYKVTDLRIRSLFFTINSGDDLMAWKAWNVLTTT